METTNGGQLIGMTDLGNLDIFDRDVFEQHFHGFGWHVMTDLEDPATFTPDEAATIATQHIAPMLRAIREHGTTPGPARDAAIAWKVWVLAAHRAFRMPAMTTNPRHTGKERCMPDALDQPLPHARPWEVSRHRGWCIQRGHPGTVYNPLIDKTWCACGEIVVDGDTATHDLCCPQPASENAEASPC